MKKLTEKTNNLFVVLILLGFDGLGDTIVNKIKKIPDWILRQYYKGIIAAQRAQQ